MARKVIIRSPGDWSHLEYEDFVCPKPKPNEVTIAVKASGVNFADVAVRQGLYSSAKKFVGWPITPGFEVAGVIKAVGRDVKKFKVGDKVFGLTLFGGYTSELNIAEEHVRQIPRGLSYSEAASIPAVFMTAYYATHWLVNVHKNTTALVHSAAGGVGLALAQMLTELGVMVIGVVGSSTKVAVAKEYGSSQVIDKSKQDLWAEARKYAPNGFDYIFDANGATSFKASYQHLRESGTLFVYGFATMLSKSKGKQSKFKLATGYFKTVRFNPFDMVKQNRSVVAFNVSYLYERTDILDAAFEFVLDSLNSGQLKTLPIAEYKFEDVTQAHKDMESGKTVGKLVLTSA